MTITFGAICSLLQSIENICTRKPRLTKVREKECVQHIVSNWFCNHRYALDDADTNGGAVLSALFPHRRKDRVYGLQAPLLAKKLVKLLRFNNSHRVLFDGWKTGALGDLGVYTERTMKSWDGTFTTKHEIPIERIDCLLVQLAAKYRFSDRVIREQRDWHVETDTELKDILVRLESWEAKWLVRLLLRDYCTIELDEKFVLQQYHFLLPDLLMFQNNFDAVFGMLRGELGCYPSVPDPLEEQSMRIEAAQKLKVMIGVKVGRPTFYKAWSLEHCSQLVGKRAWAAEVKYDGEYCEIHVDLQNVPRDITIFSKNGKDATADREALLSTIRDALRIGRPGCFFKTKCVLLGEMVLYSDKEKKILPFSKIRKHVSRSGSFMGTLQDSLPQEWENLMIVFFDVLVLDDEPVLRRCLQHRRSILRKLVRVIPGRSMRSEWTLLNFQSDDGMIDLKQVFAQALANRQEGLVLKPLHAPYFSLLSAQGSCQPGFFIKVKQDHLADFGGERDLGDFAIIGASFDPQIAPKTTLKPLHWTHFYVGCCTNRNYVQQRTGVKPHFKIVACLSLDKGIPKTDVKYLNIQGYVRQAELREDGSTDDFEIERLKGYERRMTVAFKKPFVVEILGSGYEKVQNELFEMLRHPRVKKIHHDRTWEDTVTMEELERMAEEKWEVPNAGKLDGHARDVALLVQKYTRDRASSQTTTAGSETTQETTQQNTPCTPEKSTQQTPVDAVVQETRQDSYATISTTQCSGSTQEKSIRAFREPCIFVREDTPERSISPPTLQQPASTISVHSSSSRSVLRNLSLNSRKRISIDATVHPAQPKRRRKVSSPLSDTDNHRSLGSFQFESQENTLHIYAKEGVRIQVHNETELGR